VWLSARDGRGIELLQLAIQERLMSVSGAAVQAGDTDTNSAAAHAAARAHRAQIRLEPAAGRLRAKLYEWNVVRRERVTDSGEWIVDVILRPDMLGYLQHQPGCRVVIEGEAGERRGTCDDSGGTIQSATV
jgi:hypothetical protein